MARLAAALASLFAVSSLATPTGGCASDDLTDSTSILQIDLSRRQLLQKQASDEVVAPAAVAESTVGDAAPRTPYLPSDYVIDGDDDNYLQAMDARVAADSAAQPPMADFATGKSIDVSKEEGLDKNNGSVADVSEHNSSSESDTQVDVNSTGIIGDGAHVFANFSAHEFGSESDAQVDANSIGIIVGNSANAIEDVAAMPKIVSDMNESLDEYGTNIYVEANLSGLAGFGTPLHPVDGFDGNYVVDSNDPMGWRDYRPTESPWPFDTPKKEPAAELSSSDSGGAAYDEWADYIHDDDNELDERDPDEIYKNTK